MIPSFCHLPPQLPVRIRQAIVALHCKRIVVVCCLLALTAVSSLQSATFTWDGGGTDSNFGTAANWSADSAPAAATVNTFVFTGNVRTTPTLNGTTDWATNGITFESGAGNFIVGPASGGTAFGLRFSMRDNATITQNSANDQVIAATLLVNTGAITILGDGSGTLSLSSLRLGAGTTSVINFDRNAILGNISAAGVATVSTTINVAAGRQVEVSGAIANPSTATTTLTKNGAGTLTLSNANNYGGTTTISAGTLLVNNAVGSGTGSGGLIMTAGVLGGTGIVAPDGKDISFQGGTLAVGDVLDISGSGIRDLEFRKTGGTSNFFLSSATTIRLDIWDADSYEKLVFAAGAAAFDSIDLANATLQVDSSYTGWRAGDSFDLFDWGTTPTGLFASNLILPTLSGGLSWDTTELYTSGMLYVVPEPGTAAMLGLGLAIALGCGAIGRKTKSFLS